MSKHSTGQWRGGNWWGEFETIGNAYDRQSGKPVIFCRADDGKEFCISFGRWQYERENGRIVPA